MKVSNFVAQVSLKVKFLVDPKISLYSKIK